MRAFISSSSGPHACSARPCVVTRRIRQVHPGGRVPPWPPERHTGTTMWVRRRGAVCKTAGLLKKGIRKTPDVAPLPNPAVYENQGGAWGAAGPASAPGLCLGPARSHAGPHRLGHADQPSSRVRQLSAAAVGFLALRRPAPRIASSRLRPGHVIGFARIHIRRPLSWVWRLGAARRYHPARQPSDPPDIRTSGPYQTGDHRAMIHTKSGPSLRAAVRKLRTEGVQHDGGDGAWSGLGGASRPG